MLCLSSPANRQFSPNSTWLVTSRQDLTFEFGCVELVEQQGSTCNLDGAYSGIADLIVAPNLIYCYANCKLVVNSISVAQLATTSSLYHSLKCIKMLWQLGL